MWNDDIITKYFPNALTTTYRVPPFRQRRVPDWRRETVPHTNLSTLVPTNLPLGFKDKPKQPSPQKQGSTKHDKVSSASSVDDRLCPPQVLCLPIKPEDSPVKVLDSDFQDDFAQNHVVTSLLTLGKKQQEAMFILSRFKFGNYPDMPAYAAAAAHLNVPFNFCKSLGETDIILFHRRFGILLGEIESVGLWHLRHEKIEAPDNEVYNRMVKAIDRLTNSNRVIKQLLIDIAPDLTVCHTICLPYVTSDQLKHVLKEQPQLLQNLQKCIGATNLTKAVELCISADQLSSHDTYLDINEDVLSKLSTWWQHRMATEDPLLCSSWGDSLYLKIVGRFVGPAISVSIYCPVRPRVSIEVQTDGQAIAGLGGRLSRLVLTHEQMDILNINKPLLCLKGPPGTGKTILLALQGLHWLHSGHNVHIVCGRRGSVAASHLVEQQLQVTQKADPTLSDAKCRVYFHRFYLNRDLDAVGKAVRELANAERDKTLCIIMDEIKLYRSEKCNTTKQLLKGLFKLQEDGVIKRLLFWSAGLCNTDVLDPDWLEVEQITTPLRCAPVVQRVVADALKRVSDVTAYSVSSLPSPGDGPGIICLLHSTENQEGHTEDWPVDCEVCGRNVAAILRELGVGQVGIQGDAPLAWRDVFVITRSLQVKDDQTDAQGNVTSPACGVVRGLRSAGVPVVVMLLSSLKSDSEAGEALVVDVVTARTDRVTVAESGQVQGLERRVVVLLAGCREGLDDKHSNKVEILDSVYIASRCTTQLIKVDVPQSETKKYPDTSVELISLQDLDHDFVNVALTAKSPNLEPKPDTGHEDGNSSTSSPLTSMTGQTLGHPRQSSSDGGIVSSDMYGCLRLRAKYNNTLEDVVGHEKNLKVEPVELKLPLNAVNEFSSTPIFSKKWQAMSTFTDAGGVLSKPFSDVSLSVPPGAVTKGICINVSMSVSTDIASIQELFPEDKIHVASPIAEFCAAYAFEKPLQIYLPHCLFMPFDPEQVKIIRLSKNVQGHITLQELHYKYEKYEETGDFNLQNDAFYYEDNGKFCITTRHFSGYCAIQMNLDNAALTKVYVVGCGTNYKSDCDIFNASLSVAVWDNHFTVKDFLPENSVTPVCPVVLPTGPDHKDQQLQFKLLVADLERSNAWQRLCTDNGEYLQNEVQYLKLCESNQGLNITSDKYFKNITWQLKTKEISDSNIWLRCAVDIAYLHLCEGQTTHTITPLDNIAIDVQPKSRSFSFPSMKKWLKKMAVTALPCYGRMPFIKPSQRRLKRIIFLVIIVMLFIILCLFARFLIY